MSAGFAGYIAEGTLIQGRSSITILSRNFGMPDSNFNHAPLKTLTVVDFLLIIIAVCGACGSIPFLYTLQPTTVAVYRDNTLYGEYPLDQYRELTLSGHEGLLTIVISDGAVRVKQSACRKQICVKSGVINKPFQQLVCAPNHILIELRSPRESEDAPDAIAQ